MDFLRLGRANFMQEYHPANMDYATQNFSWELEIRTRCYAVARLIYKRDSSTGKGYTAFITSSGRPGFQLHKTTGSGSIASAMAPAEVRIDDGEWHKVLFVCDRANANAADRKLHVWVDGTLAVSSAVFGDEWNTDISSASSATVLRSYASADKPEPVDLRNIRHYDYALTATDAAKIFADNYDDVTPIAYFPCDDFGDSRDQYTTYYLISDVNYSVEATADSNQFEFTAVGHKFRTGQTVRFESTGDLPTGLDLEAGYFIVNPTANTFQVSATVGGSEIEFSTDGTGVLTAIHEIAFAGSQARQLHGHELPGPRPGKPILTAMLFGDLHHTQGDSKVANLEKIVAWTVERMPDMLVGLGDFMSTEAGGEATALTNLADIKAVLDTVPSDVLVRGIVGNHDLEVVTRAQISTGLGAARLPVDESGSAYSTFTFPDTDPVIRIICLDSHDGPLYGGTWLDMSDGQLAWLEATLQASDLPSVIFCHQRLDRTPGDRFIRSGTTAANPLYWGTDDTMVLPQAVAFRAIVDAAPNGVYACWSGHHHMRHYCKLANTHYGNTDAANASSDAACACLLTVYSNGDIRTIGFGTEWNLTRR